MGRVVIHTERGVRTSEEGWEEWWSILNERYVLHRRGGKSGDLYWTRSTYFRGGVGRVVIHTERGVRTSEEEWEEWWSILNERYVLQRRGGKSGDPYWTRGTYFIGGVGRVVIHTERGVRTSEEEWEEWWSILNERYVLHRRGGKSGDPYWTRGTYFRRGVGRVVIYTEREVRASEEGWEEWWSILNERYVLQRRGGKSGDPYWTRGTYFIGGVGRVVIHTERELLTSEEGWEEWWSILNEEYVLQRRGGKSGDPYWTRSTYFRGRMGRVVIHTERGVRTSEEGWEEWWSILNERYVLHRRGGKSGDPYWTRGTYFRGGVGRVVIHTERGVRTSEEGWEEWWSILNERYVLHRRGGKSGDLYWTRSTYFRGGVGRVVIHTERGVRTSEEGWEEWWSILNEEYVLQRRGGKSGDLYWTRGTYFIGGVGRVVIYTERGVRTSEEGWEEWWSILNEEYVLQKRSGKSGDPYWTRGTYFRGGVGRVVIHTEREVRTS